ncbi:methyltransferase family protein [Piscinibacter terrae]|uniref:Isoprenylcysteine carboxylmethyltransferase family protein n=1 Tax=Piscinibacter terrae TaxID=2496871 RepID=A0A3N7HUL8_9BURK|nr:isoprenylcysteine carboxylmethyltransferase family protein [Albitalea terrae]RQP26010.1 isoprenylcysteine carboxylmethyltransferase family protein [Albitalea terrae]
MDKQQVTGQVDFAQTRQRAGRLIEEGLAIGGNRNDQPIPASGGDGAGSVLLRIPPPLVYVAAFLLGFGLQRLLPAPAAPPGLVDWSQAVGAVLLTLGVVLGPANALMFLFRGTTLNPVRTPTRLFTGGVYRFSRNPMYIGLLLIYAGVALLHWQLYALLLIWIPFGVVDRVYIPFEEQRMLNEFGADYASYCGRVGRWLTIARPAGSAD